MTELAWSNLWSYSGQIALLVGVVGLAPFVFKMHDPRARLVYWQIALVACLLLPLIQPWQRGIVVVSGEMGSGVAMSVPAPVNPPPPPFPTRPLILAVLIAGMGIRAGWLILGLYRLRRLRLVSVLLDPVPESVRAVQFRLRNWTQLRVCPELTGPVTFGLNKAVVLLPRGFQELEPKMQALVVWHELVHVGRRDWPQTVFEECVSTVFWFHPALWWLLAQIQLSREQTVDRAVIRCTQARDRYVDALLAVSGVRERLNLAPAPSFLKKHHLAARVASIVKEVEMSKRRWWLSLAAGVGALAVGGWLVVGSLPLKATPRLVADSEGVKVMSGEANLIHRARIEYSQAAREKGIQGTVVLNVLVGNDGTVNDATIISGPSELRRTALQSVLQWHYARGMEGKKVEVSIQFQLSQPPPPSVPGPGKSEAVPAPPPPPTAPSKGELPPHPPAAPDSAIGTPRTVSHIVVEGLTDSARDALLSKLPIHAGSLATFGEMDRLLQVVREFDEHLRIALFPPGGQNVMVVRIYLPGPGRGELSAAEIPPMTTARPEEGLPPAAPGVQRIRVGGIVQAHNIIQEVPPEYPPLAKQARIQGTVVLGVLIDRNGKVVNIQVVSGHPLLVQSATDAVKQWEYRPTLLNGTPVEVVTTVDVNFSLP
ncbi:MAG: M56 family metallopeptidase [Acidobacteriia bacterium]|nr:M56 family metallopeptidase [Terriglobia bacterium]